MSKSINNFFKRIMHSCNSSHIADYCKGKLKRILYYFFNFFNVSYDWLTPYCVRHRLPIKPGKLAVFTQTNNEGQLLLYWEEYYGKMVGYENLFILNNGGSDSSCSQLNQKTSVINMPFDIHDLHNCAQLQGYFQRFLLQKYSWVLKVDVDEFMACEDGLLEQVKDLPDGIYSPEMAIGVIHDNNSESPFDYNRSLFEQRKNFVEEHPSMKKPSLASVPATWAPGNHITYEKSKVLLGLWMVHLRDLDFDRLLERNKRIAVERVSADYDKTTVAASFFRGMDLESIIKATANELNNQLSKQRVILPGWITTKI